MRSFNKAFDLKDDYYTPRLLIEFLIPYLYEKKYCKNTLSF